MTIRSRIYDNNKHPRIVISLLPFKMYLRLQMKTTVRRGGVARKYIRGPIVA